MSLYYLDSSVAVRILFGHSPEARRWFDETTASEEREVVSSRLIRTELTRVLRRQGAPLELRGEILDVIGLIPLDHAVLQEAEAIIPHIKTLDAIHLASALRVGVEDIIVCTHDATMASVARQLGLAVFDPVSDEPTASS